jgi:hypothetical protein
MLLEFPVSTRAPGRGRYEREHSSSERFQAQRERLLRAVVIAHLRGEPSVTRVTALSGVGRNTFYECFDDFEHALDTARREELQRVRRGLVGSRSFSNEDDAVSRLCRAWLELIAEEPVSALVALEPLRGQRGSALRAVFEDALARLCAKSKRNDTWLSHSAACAEASGRAVALALLGSTEVVSFRDPSGPLLSEAASSLTRSVRRLVEL